MNKIIITALCSVCLLGTGLLRAQDGTRPTYAGSAFIQKIEPKATVVRDGERLGIAFDITVPARLIPSRKAYVVTPTLVSGQKQMTLPAVLFEGRNFRSLSESRTANEYRKLWSGREFEARVPYCGDEVTYHYQTSVDFEPGTELEIRLLEQTYIACRTRAMRTAEHRSVLATDWVPAPAEPQIVPEPAPAPAPAPLQTRDSRIFTDTFALGSTEFIDTEAYGGFLEKLRTNIGNGEILRIVLYPASSPEGPVSYNERLSQQRGEAVKTMLIESLGVAPEKIEIENVGENWEGLLAALPDSGIENADEIRRIVAGESDPELRDLKVRSTAEAWKIAQLYKTLRTCMVSVEYVPAEE